MIDKGIKTPLPTVTFGPYYSFSVRSMSRNAWNRILGSFMIDKGIKTPLPTVTFGPYYSFSVRSMSRNAWNRILGSFMIDKGIKTPLPTVTFGPYYWIWIYWFPVGFVFPPLFCGSLLLYICVRRRVAVARYRIICIVLLTNLRKFSIYRAYAKDAACF